MFVDSHCHLDFPGLAERLPDVLANMAAAQVDEAMCICVELARAPDVLAIAASDPRLWATVGVHPESAAGTEPDEDALVRLCADPKVRAIGETGLDYYRGERDAARQRDWFRVHVRAARRVGKPLVVHTRAAAQDTLRILREEEAGEAGGIMHCFTETWDTARAALDLGLHISISGIVTFKNAAQVREVARMVPLDRLLIETDAPYLAPVPFRGRTNEPAYVAQVGRFVAELRGMAVEALAGATSENFRRLIAARATASA